MTAQTGHTRERWGDASRPDDSGASAIRGRLLGRLGAAALGLLVWVWILFRSVPDLAWDPGVFASMAELLARGDQLYVQVWDNKDPLFFYVLALGRWVHPLAVVFIEIGWIVLCCLAVYLLLPKTSRIPRAIIAFIGAPLVVTGSVYYAGLTNLPATAITLLALGAGLRHRWLVAGVLAGLVPFLKITQGPLVVLLLIVLLSLSHSSSSSWLRCAAGWLGAVLSLALLLAARGELGGYLGQLRDNVQYASGPRSGEGGLASRLVGHLDASLTIYSQVTIASVVLVALLALLMRRHLESRPWIGNFALMSIVALGYGVLTLVLTGFSPHHAQVLAVSAVLALMAFSGLIDPGSAGESSLVYALVIILTSALLGGLVNAQDSLRLLRETPTRIARIVAPAPNSDWVMRLPAGSAIGQVGGGDVDLALRFPDVTFACPKFALYEFDAEPTLSKALSCLSGSDAIFIGGDPGSESRYEDWLDFQTELRAMVTRRFICEDVQGGSLCVSKTERQVSGR